MTQWLPPARTKDEFISHHPPLSTTSVPEALIPSSDIQGHLHSYAHIHTFIIKDKMN